MADYLDVGLSVTSLCRIWPVIDGEPTGPYWELRFKPIGDPQG